MTTTAVIDVAAERKAIVAEAHSWLRTPFSHERCLKGVGVDCAQLLIGVFRIVGLVEPFTVDHYAPDWFLHTGTDHLEQYIRRFCVKTDDPQPGDIATFKYGRHASHAAIITDFPKLIHADRVVGCVTEDACGPFDTLGKRLSATWTLTRWVA